MKVMILAAGRGQRMGRLTERCPKPLLEINGCSLIEHHIRRLKQHGFNQFVINVAYLAEQIKQALGTGQQWGVHIEYSDEGATALETGGGIHKALPLLGEGHFLLVNADVWSDISYAGLRSKVDKKIHLVLVENPEHHTEGDFQLHGGLVVEGEGKRYTYSGIGVFHPSIFAGKRPGVFPLAPLIRQQIMNAEVSAQLHQGAWLDVGTPERLAQAQS